MAVMQESLSQREKTEWPLLQQLQEHFLARIAFFRRQDSRKNKASTPTHSHLTMQQCWPTCGTEASADHKKKIDHRLPCDACFQPTETSQINLSQNRQTSHPVMVPEPQILRNPCPPADSFGSESGFGNGLSPTTTSWTVGVSDFSSCPSSLIDEIEECSISHHSSITDGPDEAIAVGEPLDFDDNDDDDQEDFEVLSFEAPPESSLFIKEFKHSTSDSQNHVCNCCEIAFDAFSNNSARRCFYYGKLYCARCHVNDLAYIPAKIIKSLDMNLYPVCRRAKAILQSYFYQGIFDIQQDNPSLYRQHPTLNEIRSLRQQLQHCYAFLSTCARLEKRQYDKIFEEFSLRDYLYQSIHDYSISDLLTLKKIQQMLSKAVLQAKKHIRQCVICRGKGFTCEICKNRSDVLYPFDDAKVIGTCSTCSNLYHRRCWKQIEGDCPRCYRFIQRKHQAKSQQKRNDDD